MNMKMLVFSIIGGVVITLLTGLISNTPMLLGATHYGYPFAWLIRLILAPEYFPWRINTVNFVVDIIIWAFIVGIILLIVKKKRK
jgi:hypothetical protein